jgi:hypothetical protein
VALTLGRCSGSKIGLDRLPVSCSGAISVQRDLDARRSTSPRSLLLLPLLNWL